MKTENDVLKNKIVIDAKVILSEKQLYLMELYSGCNEKDAKEEANSLYNNPENTSELFKSFCGENGDMGGVLNDVINLGLQVIAKTENIELSDCDMYHDYLTIKKAKINSIDIDYIDVNENCIDTLENMKKNNLDLHSRKFDAIEKALSNNIK